MRLIYDRASRLLPLKGWIEELPEITTFDFRFMPCFCGESGYTGVANTTRHGTPLNVVQCRRCGTLRINPYLTDEGLDRYYRDYYRSVKHGDRDPAATYENQAKHAGPAYSLIRPHLRSDMTILDYGCASGGRMDPFLAEGYAVSGFDLDETFVRYAESRGVARFDPAQRYDVIYLSHVVEHINEPVRFLKNLATKNLGDDGFVFINVPLIDRQRGYERHDYLLSEVHLAHKFYFTSPSLRLLAAMSGFTQVAESGDNFLFRADGSIIADWDDPELIETSNAVLKRARRHLACWRATQLLRALKQTGARRLGLSARK